MNKADSKKGRRSRVAGVLEKRKILIYEKCKRSTNVVKKVAITRNEQKREQKLEA
jgi:hypothetical protein